MKTRSLLLLAILVALSTYVFSQKATADQVGNKEVRGLIYEYVTDKGVTFKVGDTLEVGHPFRNNQFSYLMDKTSAVMGSMVFLSPQYVGSMCVIKSMRASQRKLTVATFGQGESIALYIVNFEAAVATGEIVKPNYMSSDQALEILKKAKDKLDLELISQEEYDAIKADLIKFIK